MACADLLPGADRGFAVALVVLTGLLSANLQKPFLKLVRAPADGVTTGLAVGTAGHGLGTAALAADDPEAFSFAAVAMALVGATSTVMVAAPPVRAALVSIALGGAAV